MSAVAPGWQLIIWTSPVLLLCRIYARIAIALRLEPFCHGGPDYIALSYYHRFSPRTAMALMAEWFPEVEYPWHAKEIE